MSLKDEILKLILEQYLESDEFNGFPVSVLTEYLDNPHEIVSSLIREGKVNLSLGQNPHILAFEPPDIETQLSTIESTDLLSICLYPSKAVLREAIPESEMVDRPFTRELRIGEPQLKFSFFELSVLEQYRNDPRYYYDVWDFGGRIGLKSENYSASNVMERDKVFLQTFGFGYSCDLEERVVVVMLHYLSKMTPEHQQIWRAKLLSGDYCAHPEYIRSALHGEFPQGISVFQAFTEEMREVNKLAQLMGRKPFFRDEYCDESRPREFGFLIRPTLREYNDFVHLLDKMLSENVDRDFFQGEVEYETETEEPNGKISRQSLNSISILRKWLYRCFQFDDWQSIEEMLSTFRKIRKERQAPGHKIVDNEFDMALMSKQRELMIEAYKAISTLRRILSLHPLTIGYTPHKWLSKKIWIY